MGDTEQPSAAAPSAKTQAAGPLRRVRAVLAPSAIALQALAGISGTAVAGVAGLRDWYMHLSMHGILLVFVLLYVQAHQRGRRFGRAFELFINLLLNAFFVAMLIDRAAPVQVFVEGALRWREAIPLFFLPIGLMGLSMLALVLHWAFVPVRRAPTDTAPPKASA